MMHFDLSLIYESMRGLAVGRALPRSRWSTIGPRGPGPVMCDSTVTGRVGTKGISESGRVRSAAACGPSSGRLEGTTSVCEELHINTHGV